MYIGDAEIKVAKEWAKAHGYKGQSGGWIYNAAGKPVTQGWWSFAKKFWNRIAAPAWRSMVEA